MTNETEQKNTTEQGTQQEDAGAFDALAYHAQGMESIIRKNHASGEEQAVPLWLVTFTDVIALMLTFFVLLYSMSTPQVDQWEKITASLGNNFEKQFSRAFSSGTQDTINIDRIPTTRALDLKYLKTLVTEHIKQEGLKDVAVNEEDKSLVISLPSNLLFSAGAAEIISESKPAIYALGAILSRIKNRIEIIGHSDPRPINAGEQSAYQSNWELSLARSVAVSAMLRSAGYEREIIVRGLSSSRYDELPTTINEDERLALARRVDIVIMQDTIEQATFLNMP